ncbi:MAG TPA: hypothetical protein VJA25_11435 [Dehalococcoidia bacterium]|nr:hypothetical protein [Dehalococcoidia bacterium]
MTTPEESQASGSWDEVSDLYYRRGMTDGLPIVPPTAERVAVMVAASGREPGAVLGKLPPLWASATVEKVAVNAVMAGCLPEYMSVVLAAVEVVAEEQFNLYAVQATGSPVSPGFVVNGPVAGALGINAGYNALGQGHRANATIGRALRLVLINIGGGRPGDTDRATQGWPGKFTLCFAENEAESPWDPLHVELGYDKQSSTITGFGACGTTAVTDPRSQSAEGILLSLANHMTPNLAGGGQPVVVIAPENAHVIARDGFTKDDVKLFLWEHARLPVTAFSQDAQIAAIKVRRESGRSPYSYATVAAQPGDILVVVAGGAGYHSTIIPTIMARATTRVIR